MGLPELRMPFMYKAGLAMTASCFLLLLAACNGNGSVRDVPPPDRTEDTVYAHPGLGPYDPPVALSFVRETGDNLYELLRHLPGETLEDNRWSRLYEQVLGIRIQYEWTAKGDLYRQKLGAALASGDIPDVVKVNAQQLRQLSEAGLIQDLTEAYEQFATPFTKRILAQEGPGPFEAATIDGRLMGIPETLSSIEGAEFLWIRTDWLERLGLEPPRTMEDLLAISKAFTEMDPDGNGEHDTFGLAVTQYLWDPAKGLTGFMAGFHAYPNLWIEDDAGRLVYGAVQPEVKRALQVLQDMYRDGQIDSEFVFKDGMKVREQIASGKIGMTYGQQWASFEVQASYTNNPEADWKAFPIVAVAGTDVKVPLRFPTYQFLAVRKGYEHPEAIVKLFNLHLEKNWGETAEYETYYSTPYPAWQLSPVTPFPARKNLEAYRQLEEMRRTGDMSVLKDEARSIHRKIEDYLQYNEETGWGWEKTYGPDGAFAILDQYEKNGRLLYERFYGAPTETMIELLDILENLKNDVFISIILGSPIDEFDRFVEEWHRLGGREITEEVNRWYASRG
jgi:putative aldouronate transport system substrate-binding protein